MDEREATMLLEKETKELTGFSVSGDEVDLSQMEDADGEMDVVEEISSTTFTKAEKEKMKMEVDRELEESFRDDGTQVLPASAAEERRNYTAGASYRIRPIGKALEFESATQKWQRKRNEFDFAARSFYKGEGQILKGTVAAVSTMRVGHKDASTGKMQARNELMLVIYDGPIAVYIPVTRFTRLRVQTESSAERRTSLANIANERLGSEVEFMVRQFDEKHRRALGTRLEVLDRTCERYYKTKGKKGYLVNDGDILEARVIYVSSNYVGIEAFGVESAIPVQEVTWTRTDDLFSYFRETYGTNMVGKTIPVKVLEVNRKDPSKTIFSIKRGAPDERSLYRSHLENHRPTLMGTIMNVNKTGIYAKIDNMPFDIRVSNNYNRQEIPVVGQKVVISLHRFNVDQDEYGDPKYNLDGYIVRNLG
uniref:hypothetical protein n=1 Tax=Eubacterium cellulosolvens TaxID=29322 RepID=UPI000487B9A1|nr:hypothetical protein [[Eubacterium] cellulosolvens]